MPEQPVSLPLSTSECVATVFARIDALLALDICEACALKLAMTEFHLKPAKMLALYYERTYDDKD